MTEREMWTLALGQLAMISREQALAAIGRRRLERLVDTGRLTRPRDRVYRIAGAPTDAREPFLAACLAAGDGAVVSHLAAGALWSMRGVLLGLPELLVEAPRRLHLPGVITHLTTCLPPAHVTTRGPVPVTSPARTMFDLSTVVSPWLLGRIIDESSRRGLASYAELGRCADLLAARGRRKLTVVRALLDNRGPGYHPGDSDPEVDIAQALTRAGLPRPAQQHQVVVGKRVFLIDVAYPDIQLGIEYDSEEAHSGFAAKQHDRARDRALMIVGWKMLHFGRGDAIGAVVRDVAAARARLLSSAGASVVAPGTKVAG